MNPSALPETIQMNVAGSRAGDGTRGTERLGRVAAELAQAALELASEAELARLLVRRIAELLAGTRAFVFEFAAGARVATLVTDPLVPRTFDGLRLALTPGSRLETLIARAGSVLHVDPRELVADAEDARALGLGSEPVACLAIGAAGGPVGILVAAPAAGVAPLDVSRALAVLGPVYGALRNPARGADARADVAAISRAKAEWEATADALPQIVALLGRSGRVLRANRTVERWGRGSVRDVRGLTLHAMLHGGCDEAGCALAARLARAWSDLAPGAPVCFEHRDPLLGRSLAFTLCPVRLDVEDATPAGSQAVAVVADVTELARAREALHAANEGLELRVRERTAELRESVDALGDEVRARQVAERSLTASRNELALLTSQLLTAQEDERKRIAQELHDAIGQSLSAVKYTVERASELLAAGQHADVGPLLGRSVEGIQSAVHEMRRIAMHLRPSIIDDLGVASAVRWLCRTFGETYPLIELQLDVGARDADVPVRLASPVFRFVQEALNNVAQHAGATRVDVALRTEGDLLVLSVADDGVGFDPETVGPALYRGHGVRGMRERVELSGGRFRLASVLGEGTRLEAEWGPFAAGGVSS